MTRDLVLGVDASTTAVKAVAFDASGNALAEGRAPIALENPEPDGWEQDAGSWWRAFTDAVRSVTASLAGDASRIRALAIAHQRETFVLVDEDGAPAAPARVWMDARCRDEVAAVVATTPAAALHRTSGKPPAVTPSLYKIRHLLRTRPDLAMRRLAVHDVHGFLVSRLVGERVTSLASADPLGMIALATHDWADELLGIAGLERAQVDRIVATGSAIGELGEPHAADLGLRPGTTVVAGAGDGQAAALGVGLVARGRAYMNFGTAIVAGALSETPTIDRAFRTLHACLADTYLLETDLLGGTFSLDWLVDRVLGGARDLSQSAARSAMLADLEARAGNLEPGAGGLVFVPYMLGVMNPHWDDDARGILFGLRGDHGAPHIYRAMVEGLAFEARRQLEAVEAATERISEIVVTGGATQRDGVCQLLADVFDKPLVRSGSAEATALGAAMLAAAGSGLFANVREAASRMSATGARFTPGSRAAAYDRIHREVYVGLYESTRDRMHALTALARR